MITKQMVNDVLKDVVTLKDRLDNMFNEMVDEAEDYTTEYQGFSDTDDDFMEKSNILEDSIGWLESIIDRLKSYRD